MQTKNTTRRAVLAGIAAAPALAAPALALPPSAPDPADWNPKAALARLEQVIETLRTCVVCDGWHPNGLDEAAAARALAYFRAGLPEESDHDFSERDAALDFIRSHGQSLDWIICGDAGGMICGAAKLSKRAQSLSGPDPIFAAMERHRAAADAYTAMTDEHAEIESADVPRDDPRWGDFERLAKDTCDQLKEANRHLFEAPMGIAGLVVLVEYMEEQRRAGNGSWDDAWSLPVDGKMVSALVGAVRRLGAVS